jgi:hypothetical protein
VCREVWLAWTKERGFKRFSLGKEEYSLFYSFFGAKNANILFFREKRVFREKNVFFLFFREKRVFREKNVFFLFFREKRVFREKNVFFLFLREKPVFTVLTGLSKKISPTKVVWRIPR